MSSFNTFSLYIKRAESQHTKEYIRESLFANNYGKVRDVRFINKINDYGFKYNGVIVLFEHWFMNSKVKQLFDEMNASPDGTTRLYHDAVANRYWHVQEYKSKFPDFEEINTINSSMPDSEKVKELELLVKSMAAQLYSAQLKIEKNEMKTMEYEQEQTRQHLHNTELRAQLNEKDLEVKWAEEDMLEKEKYLEGRISSLIMDCVKKERECDMLKQQLYDQENIIMYIAEECASMKKIL